MKFSALERVFRALNEAGVRYLVAGGVAVNAHGYQRLTADLDLVVALERENVLRALEALEEMGFGPTLPVPARAFADQSNREQWHKERNLQVFSLVSGDEPGLAVDLFVREPFPFDGEYERAMVAEIAPGLEVPFVALSTLIEMKERTGRPRDRDDAEHLRWILEEKEADRG